MRKSTDDLKVDALLITKHCGAYRPMAKSTIQVRVKRIGKIIGLDDFHSHCIRKSRLSSVYDITGDLALAAELANPQNQPKQHGHITSRPKKQDRNYEIETHKTG